MGFLKTLLDIGAGLAEEMGKSEARRISGSAEKIGGRTLREWERSWQPLGTLSGANISHLSNSVGLYRATLNSTIVYIGRAVEYANGGLRKRLSDYTRDSDSARKHQSGQLMHQNASRLHIDILVTGSDSEAAETARKLERCFIGMYSPEWNRMLK